MNMKIWNMLTSLLTQLIKDEYQIYSVNETAEVN